MATSVTVQVQDDQPSPSAVEELLVQVYEAGGPFVTEGLTDEDGEVVFSLPDADYDLLFYKQGVSILPRQPQRITVDEDLTNTFLVTAHVRTLPEATNPRLCRISGYFYGPDGTPRVGKLGVQLAKEVVTTGNNVVLPLSTLLVASDENGYVEFDLIRGLPYEAYFVHLEQLIGQRPPKHEILVPDLPALALDRLLFPVPVSATFSETTKTISLAAGADISVTVETVYSDGGVRTAPTFWGNTQLEVDDEDVLGALIYNGILQLTPKAVGSTTLTFTRKITTGVTLDELPEFTTETLTVTVDP